MRGPDAFTNIFLYRDFVDMRKSINGLTAIIQAMAGVSLFGNDLVVFTNRSRNLIKAVYWRRTGFALWMFRLEKSRFPWPKKSDTVLTLTPEQLNQVFDGYDIFRFKPHETLNYEKTF